MLRALQRDKQRNIANRAASEPSSHLQQAPGRGLAVRDGGRRLQLGGCEDRLLDLHGRGFAPRVRRSSGVCCGACLSEVAARKQEDRLGALMQGPRTWGSMTLMVVEPN